MLANIDLLTYLLASFSIWNHEKNNLFLTNWVMWIFFFLFFSMQNIKGNCYIIFLKFFPVIFFLMKIYSLPFTFVYKDLIFVTLSEFFQFLHDLMWLSQRIESIFYLSYWWDLCCFFIKSRGPIYNPTWFGFYFMTFITQ